MTIYALIFNWLYNFLLVFIKIASFIVTITYFKLELNKLAVEFASM
jgi:hypothetical protein